MTVLLKETIKPNLVQTLEGQPAFVHCGPFANIAHGNNSLVADRVALKLGDIVVTESGFGSDMGMEKFMNIVCRVGKLTPSAVVLVVTAKALKHHAGDPDGGVGAIREGAANMNRHLGIIREFGLNAVVAVNRFPDDTDEEIELVREIALANGAFAAEPNEAVVKGGEGAAALAEAVVAATEQPSSFAPLYPLDDPIEAKIEAIAKRVYGADGIFLLKTAREKIKQFTSAGSTRCRSAWRRRISRSPTMRRSRMRPRASPSPFATFVPIPEPAGSSRSSETCRRCPGTGRRRLR